jgi:glucose-1-phosphate cytidylyltransferase
MDLDGDRVISFTEKSQATGGWINGGFFVFEPAVLDFIASDDMALERDPLERLAAGDQLMAFRHPGFWEPMDTQRDLDHLNGLWTAGSAPWKVWSD